VGRAIRFGAFGVSFLAFDVLIVLLAASTSAFDLLLMAALVLALSLIPVLAFPHFRQIPAVVFAVTLLFLVIQLLFINILRALGGLSAPLTALFLIVTDAACFLILTGLQYLKPDARLRRLDRAFSIVLVASAVIVADIMLLTYFNTLVWPYFWPNSAFLILAIGFVVLIWFPELGYSTWMLRIVGLLLIFIGQSYVVHSYQMTREHPSVLTVAHLVGVSGMLLVLMVNYVNQMRPKNHQEAPPLPSPLPPVAVVVPTYGEPYDVLEKTVASLKRVDYPPELLCIVISDDGHRPEVRYLADRQQVYYNEGPQKDAKAGNLNSALAFLDQVFPQADLILTQDADEVVHPTIIKKLVGYFVDPAIAFVQTPKEVIAPTNDPFGTRDRMFFDVFQVGRNGYDAAFACGSGVMWRISAVKSIGGFATWNVVEDLTTSYLLHNAGYRSEYHNEKLSIGLAPDDIPGLLKQRGTWAVDTWRLFLFDNPLFKRGALTFGQRLQYFELGLFYVMSSFFMPVLMFIPVVSLLTGEFMPIQGSALFPWLTINFLYYVVLSRGQSLYMLRMWQYWIGHWPTYLKAFWVAVWSRNRKPKYVVTRKTRDSGFYPQLLWLQFLYIILGLVAIVYGLFGLPNVDLGERLANIGVVVFFIYMISMICRAAFYGVESMLPRWLARMVSPRRGEHGRTTVR
jgi:cellulose synthase (UDP-forming)